MIQRLLVSLLGTTLAALLVLLPEVNEPRSVAPAAWSFGHGPTVVLVHGLGSRVGHWFPTARLLARNHRVVLVETVLRPSIGPAERRDVRAALETDWDGTLEGLWASFGRDSVQGAELSAAAARVDPATMRAWIDLALDTDLSNAAAGLRVPVRAVFAARNWKRGLAWPLVAVELGYERVARVTPERLEKCGHFVMLDRPAELARIIASETAAAPVKPSHHPPPLATLTPN